jgi:hypothetical protein
MVDFRCYDPSADGSGGIHRWYNEVLPELQSAIDSALEVLKREKKLDGNFRFKQLRKKCSGLAEIKVDVPIENVPELAELERKKRKDRRRTKITVRLLGPDEPPNTQFLLLLGFIKWGDNQYGPACREAHKRHKGVAKDVTKAKPCDFP